MKTAVFYEHILEGAKQSGKSVAELMEKCASWNIRGIEIGDALLRENKEEIKELLEKNHMQVSCSNAFYDFGHNPDAAQGKKQIDILVTLEDFDGPVQPFARTYQLLWFMENVPGLKFTLDTGNFAYSDEDTVQAYEVLKDYIVHVHCKDRNVDPALTGEHRYNRGLLAAAVGSGYLPMKEILDRLKESGYEDYLAIEHFNAADQVAFMEQSAAFLQQYL